MFLSVHVVSGIVIGGAISNPILGFILGLISHFILDIIPHGDEIFFKKGIKKGKENEIENPKDIKNKREINKKRFYPALIIDFLVTFLIIFSFFFYKQNINFFNLSQLKTISLTSPIIWTIVGATLPDFIWGAYDLSKFKYLKPLANIHSWFHCPIGGKIKMTIGLILQTVIFGILLYLIIF